MTREVIAKPIANLVGTAPRAVCGGRGATALPAVVVNDVLVGEVWLCAGQSNMGVPLCGGNPRYRVKS